MSVVVELHDDSVDDVPELLVDDRTLELVAREGATSTWTLPVKVRARGGVVQLVVHVRAYKATEVKV